MIEAAIVLSAKEWLLPASIALGLGAVFVGWSYFRTHAPRGLRLVCAVLKTLGLAALAACLLEPTLTGERAKPGANILAIVADNSQSMTLRDRGAAESRGDSMRHFLTGERNGWQTRLAENFDVRSYLADARLQPSDAFRDLTFEGRTSPLGHTLSQLGEQLRGQSLAGTVLLTDGIAADLGVLKTANLPPIYPVIFGGSGPERDLAVTGTSVTQTSFEDAPVTVQAEVAASGFAGEEIEARLFAIEPANEREAEAGRPRPAREPRDEGVPAPPPGKLLLTQVVAVPRESDKIVFRFQLRPTQTGVTFYRLAVAPKRETTEATLTNNETVIAVDRGAGPHRVLYVSGRPNWEYKFLHRAIEGDAETQLVALMRVANREPKFAFRGRAGESSNPLFRGFGNQSREDVERYDQPVFVRLNLEEADIGELRGGFPKTAEELFKYRALILDDVEAEFFTAEQMSLVQRFVSERGGGLLMLGGMESFREGRFARTAIGDMLPMYLEAKNQEAGVKSRNPGNVRLALTREGWLQPWARLRAEEAGERQRLAALPSFEVLNRAGGPKPAAMVVATATDGTQEFPAMVTQRFGRGRTSALLIGDLWHAGLGDETRQADLMKAWRQIVRWMVADVPDPMELRVEPAADGGSVRVQVRARDAKFEPLENATVALRISRPEAAAATQPIMLAAEASSTEPGLYEATYIARESGGYRVDAAVTNESGAPAGAAATGWTSDLAAAEFRDLKANRAAMEQWARQTGGRVLSPDELEAFARELPAKRAPVVEAWSRPLWHTPWMLLFALGCFVGEWGLRRWKGLA